MPHHTASCTEQSTRKVLNLREQLHGTHSIHPDLEACSSGTFFWTQKERQICGINLDMTGYLSSPIEGMELVCPAAGGD